MKDTLRGHKESIEARFTRDQDAFLPLPASPYDACAKIDTRVSSLSLVRYKSNDYSTPEAYGHREVHVHEVVISCGTEEIARHKRSYEKEGFIYNPLHYLPLLEMKVGTLDQATPLQGIGVAEGVYDTQILAGSTHG